MNHRNATLRVTPLRTSTPRNVYELLRVALPLHSAQRGATLRYATRLNATFINFYHRSTAQRNATRRSTAQRNAIERIPPCTKQS
jgi:hypothetical protein